MEPEHRGCRCNRPHAFARMEVLVKQMQDSEHGGVPVRSQKLFLTSIPAAFMGYDMIEWLIERFKTEESEALNIAHQLCQYGYFFPISDSKNLVVKDDSSLYRFQIPYYWPCHSRSSDNVEYAIYLVKRTLRNKQRHGLEEYELESLSNLKKNLVNKWDYIMTQAEEQVRLSKGLKKADKLVADSQERAYWRVHRPPPGIVGSLEPCPVPTKGWNGGCRSKKKTIDDYRREVEFLRKSLSRTRVKMSQAMESLVQYVDIYSEYDYFITPTQPYSPWVAEDTAYWQLNSPLADVATEKRVRRWALSMEELLSDPTGLQEFTNYLRREYSHENIRFWLAVNDLRRSAQSQIPWKVQDIFEEFLAPGAPCEINIDGKTMEKVHQEMKTPNRFTFDAAQEHVYTLLLKKDCYPRFIRSDYYKNLLAIGVQPLQKKRRPLPCMNPLRSRRVNPDSFFGFGKKASTSAAPNQQQLQQQQALQQQPQAPQQQPAQSCAVMCGTIPKRRGSDRSMSGSAHELAVSGVNKDSNVPHSHSQSNLSDIPYRAKKPNIAAVAGTSASEDVCPWEYSLMEPRSRKNSVQLDSGSSSSDVSVAVAEVAEKVQRSCVLKQQHTLDSCRNLSATHAESPRRASFSVPVTRPSVEPCERKICSFEDAVSATTSSAILRTSDTDNNPEETPTTSYSRENAPTISVSSAIDERPAEERSPTAAEGAGRGQMAPLAEPDGESPASELPPSELGEEPCREGDVDGEAKSNDVCPWEDEETCKVDTPFVKTYATLGYL